MKTLKINFKLKTVVLLMAAVVVLAACKKDETEDMTPAPTPLPQEKNIVETAQSLPQFSILVDAVVKAANDGQRYKLQQGLVSPAHVLHIYFPSLKQHMVHCV